MKKLLSLVCVFVILIGIAGCANLPEDTSYPDADAVAEENLPPEPIESEYIPQLAQTARVRGNITNRTRSLTISDIEIVCADMQQLSGIHLLDTLPPEERPLSSRATIDYYHDVRIPAISFAYETDTSSGRAVLVLSDAPIEKGSLRHLEISVEFRERDGLFVEVRSNLRRSGKRTVIYRYFPEISQWLPAQERQRLFVAEVEPGLLFELYPAAEWDSSNNAVVIFTDEPLIDLSFHRLVSEDPDIRELVLDSFGDTLDMLMLGQYIVAPYPLQNLYAQHRDINGVVHTQRFDQSDRGGHFPRASTSMVDSSWSVAQYNEEAPQPRVYNSAFERAVEIRNIRNIDESTLFVVIEYESMSREELAQIENLERFDAGSGQRFVVIPRYEDSDIFMQVRRWAIWDGRLSFEERQALNTIEITHRSQNTPQNYALVVGEAESTSETTAYTILTMVGGGYRARHYFWGDEPGKVFFSLSIFDEVGSHMHDSWVQSIYDTPLANNATLRRVLPGHSATNELYVTLEDGQVFELDGDMLFPWRPQVSPEGDMIANLLSRPQWSHGALYLFDVYAQTYRELEIDGMPDSHVPFWVRWLDNSYLLVGSMSTYERDVSRSGGEDVYVYIVEEDRFFKLFETNFRTQIRGMDIDGDIVTVEYFVECNYYRYTMFDSRERLFSLREIYALIASRQTYAFEAETGDLLCNFFELEELVLWRCG